MGSVKLMFSREKVLLLLGYFFKNKQVSKIKEDMFIFVTPRIVQSSEETQDKVQSSIEQEKKQHSSKYMSIWKEEPSASQPKDAQSSQPKDAQSSQPKEMK